MSSVKNVPTHEKNNIINMYCIFKICVHFSKQHLPI